MSAEDTLLKCSPPISGRSQLLAISMGEHLVGPFSATLTHHPVGVGPKVSESPATILAAGIKQAPLG